MKRLFPLFVLSFIISSCFGSVYDDIRINIDRASKVKTRLSELCSKVEIIPVDDSVLDGSLLRELMLMDVTKDYVFLLTRDKDEIEVFDNLGNYINSLKATQVIIDFSTYKDIYLDVLDGNRIVEYDLTDFSLKNTFIIPETELELISLTKRDNNVFLLSAVSKGKAYYCYYTIDLTGLYIKDHFYYSESNYTGEDDYRNSRFFRCNGYSYSYFSKTGVITIYTDDDFIFRIFEWDWGEYASSISFSNVQKTTDNLYMRFNVGYEERTLIYNTDYRRYKIIRQTKEGVSFPVGIIHEGINYYCTPSSELHKYLNPKVKGVEIVGNIEGIGTEDSLVLIKYYLK